MEHGNAGQIMSRSFELVYYDPLATFSGRTHFRDDERPSLTTEQRIAYLRHYARLVKEFFGIGEDFLATTIISTEELRKTMESIKPRPCPQIRQVIPIKYWRWKLEGDDGKGWVEPSYDDALWNELETPRLISRNKPLLLRTTVQPPPSERLVLDIESILDEYTLWANGQQICHHAGYEPHQVDLTRFLDPEKDNSLALRIQAKEGYQNGIAGEITLLATQRVYWEDVFVKTLQVNQRGEARVRLELVVGNDGGDQFRGTAEVSFYRWFPEEGDSPIYSTITEVEIGAGEKQKKVLECNLRGVDAWWPHSPRLYRVSVLLRDLHGVPIDDYVDTCGFRTIQQRDGRIYLNGHPFFVKSFGEDMGFAPGFDCHGAICPPDEWMVQDMLLCKKANANTMRLHPWGFSGVPGQYNEYGWPEWGTPTDATNYGRIAEIADQLGLCLFWGTRHWTLWGSGFQANYQEEEMRRMLMPSIQRVRNHPSIIIYEGLNEVGVNIRRRDLSQLYASFRRFLVLYVETVNAVDDSRLILPDSPWGPFYKHNARFLSPDDERVYHADNVAWDVHEYHGWYSDLKDMYHMAPTYWPEGKERPVLMTECGHEAMPDWQRYRGFPWHGIWLNNGRPSAAIEQARLGRPLRLLRDSEVEISQAYQALCLSQLADYVRTTGADGMNINLIADGLMEGNYHKGVTDLYRKAKLGYFGAAMAYQEVLATGMDGDFVLSPDDSLKLKVAHDATLTGQRIRVAVQVKTLGGEVVDSATWEATLGDGPVMALGQHQVAFPRQGLYQIQYEIAAVTPTSGVA